MNMITIMKTRQTLILTLFFIISWSYQAVAQSEEDVVFWVEDEAVSVGEFMYIYEKNNSSNSAAQSSIREYLDLYQNFKLKVHHAKQLGLDTLSRLQSELKGYKEQLSNSYLSDDRVMERLAREVYDRMQERIEVRHILLGVFKKGQFVDTTEAFQRANQTFENLSAGLMSFDEMAKAISDDQSSRAKAGYVGWIQAPLPKGYYGLESAIYKTKAGQIHSPVRSPRGYHIIQVVSRKPARPNVEFAHLFIDKSPKNGGPEGALTKINEHHQALVEGADFNQLVRSYTNDDATRLKGGVIGKIKTGQFDIEFEEAIYRETENKDFSNPIESRVGYHIVKRVREIPVMDFAQERRRLENELRQLDRSDIARRTMVDRISKEEGLKIHSDAQNAAFEAIDASVFSHRWTIPDASFNDVLISYDNGVERTIQSFFVFVESRPKERAGYRKLGLEGAKTQLLQDFIEKENLSIEKAQLEKKYPEFKALMREYEEGIYLFEVTKDHVWDKAASDTSGLKSFFEEHRDNYQYPAELRVTKIILADVNDRELKAMMKKLKKVSLDEFGKIYGPFPVDTLVIKSDDDVADNYEWKKNSFKDPTPFGQTGKAYHLEYVVDLKPASPKPFKACRGYVIADYQEALHDQWLEQLRNQYQVRENVKVIKQLIRR